MLSVRIASVSCVFSFQRIEPPLSRKARSAIDPCRLPRHLRRDVGLDDYPCEPRMAPRWQHFR